MSFILKLFDRVKKVNLTICGLDKAGKTTLVNYLIHGEFRETIPTAGMNREIINLPKLQFDVFDLGGQTEFRGLWSEYNEYSDALIYVIDIVDSPRLKEAKDIFYEIVFTQVNQNIPMLILLNKCDLNNEVEIVEFAKDFGLTKPELEIKWAVFKTSAVTGEGILDSFQWLVNLLGGE